MPTDSPQHRTDWSAIYERIQAGEYEVAARHLLDLQIASLQVGDSTSAGAAAAARQICLALVSYRAEIEWHQLAQGNAELRRRALSQNVLSLLSSVRDDARNQIHGAMTSAAAEMTQDKSVETQESAHANLWQRIQQLLERQRPSGPAMGEESDTDQENDDQEDASLPTSSHQLLPEDAADEPNTAPASAIVEETEPSEPITAEDRPLVEPATTQEELGGEPVSPQEKPPSETPSAAAMEEVVPAVPTQPPDSTKDIDETDAGQLETIPEMPVNWSSSNDEPPDLVVYCLGSFRIQQHGRPIEHWNGLKGLSVIKYLVAHRGTPVSKDVLMDVFWPEADLVAARRNLHQAIYSLRQTLRRHDPDVQHIRFENNQYLLDPALSVWVDVEEFEKHVRHGRIQESSGQLGNALVEYEIAVSLYQGAFLEEDVYEDWPDARREHLRTTFLEIADRVTKHYVRNGVYAAAIGLCQKLLGQDACYENAHRRLMRCYIAQGQRNLAIRQYQTCVQTLREELDVPPSEETVSLYEEFISRR